MRPSVWALAAAAPVLTTCHVAQGARSQPSTAFDAAPKANLAIGTYIGRHSTEYGQDFFLGLPFAQPPVGPLRYVAPQSLNTTFDEPRNATKYGPECIGYGFDQWILGNYISEDCLTLNVIRPEGYSVGDDLPVAVWIHGGVGTALTRNDYLS